MKKKKELSKKYLLIRGSIFLIVGIVSLILVIYYNFIRDDKDPFNSQSKISDQIKFKEEYEKLNNVVDSEGNYKYIQLQIDEDNRMTYKTSKEIVDIIENKTGVIYFGFSKCPWCRNAISALIEAAQESNVEEIYYLDISEIRNELVIENEKIVTKKEGTKDYLKLVELLDEHLNPYDGLNDETIKRIYAPSVIFVRDGEVLEMHEGTVESQTNAKVVLDNNQFNELKQIYINAIKRVYDNNVCSDDKC